MALFRRNADPDAPRIPRKDRRGMSPVLVGGLVLLAIALLTFFGFTKKVPFTHGFRVNAVFETANSIRPNSPVRIAGVNVGKVTKIERYKDTDASVVTLELKDSALPVHKDATAKIRPRIFLEGNFFVDLQPGTPSAPTIGDGDTIPMTQTAAPVQFGDVLTSLQADTRKSLQQLLDDYGSALTSKPSAADDAQADPDVRGKTAAQSLNKNLDYAGPALRNASIVNEAVLGVRPDDLGTAIASLAKITGALGRNERQLQDFVTNFNATMKIFADESSNLQASVRELGPTLRVTNRTLGDLNASFPATRAFAHDILPGVRETPATIDASFPWIKQVRGLLSPSELQGVARELSPATRDLATTIDATTAFLPQASLAAQCLYKVVLPTGDIVIQDGPNSSGKENYKEFWYSMVGLSSEGQNTDGNGPYVRFQPGVGSQTLSTGKASISGETLFGRYDNKPLGTRPAYPGKRPPYRPDVPCHTNKIPDLNGAATGRADTATEATPPTIGDPKSQPQSPVGIVADVINGLSSSAQGAFGPLSPTINGAVNGATGAANDTLNGVLGATGAARSAKDGNAAAARRGSAKRSRARARIAKDDVAAQLLDRLNPFRARQKAARR